MSYLDTPRFHFLGKFFANPSTINNATENYNPAEVYNNNPPSAANPNSVEPDGTSLLQAGQRIGAIGDHAARPSHPAS